MREPSELVTGAALKETNLALYPPGTLLVAMYGEGRTRGRVAELGISSMTNQALAALALPESSSDLKRWLLVVLRNEYERLRRSASCGVQPNLNLSIIRAIRVRIPPPAERSRILEEFKSLLSLADEVEIRVEIQVARC